MTSRALMYAARPRVVGKYVGELCVPLSLALLLPLAAAVAAGSWGPAAALAASALVAGITGWRAARAPDVGDLQTNEAMAVVALAFTVAATLLVPTLMAYGLGPTDAFFEAVSGITTTGLTVLPRVSDAPWDLLLLRSWLQWYGGLGFVTLSVLLVTRSGRVAQRLDTEEGGSGDLAGHTRTHGRRALLVYVGITVAGILLLVLSGFSALDAVVHAFSSVSTGGFATRDTSLAEVGGAARSATTLLFILGALPLLLVHRIAQGRWRPSLRDPQLVGLVAMGLLAAALLVVLTPGQGASWTTRLGDAVFLAFSAQTTTGFSTTDPGALPAGARLVLVAAMLVGGCAGSTAGGIKVWRFLAALRLARHSILSTALPEHAVRTPTFQERKLDDETGRDILILFLLFAGVIGLSWLAFLAAGHPPLDSLFDVVSATATVGLDAGVAGPELETGLKWVLALDMLMGRLEILAVLVLLAPGTWFGRRRSAS